MSDSSCTESLHPSLHAFVDWAQDRTFVRTRVCLIHCTSSDHHAYKTLPFTLLQLFAGPWAGLPPPQHLTHSVAAAKQFRVTRWTAGCKHSVLLLPWQSKWKYLRGSSQARNFRKVHFQASIEYTDGAWKQRGRLVTFIVAVKAAAEWELKELAQNLLLLQPSKEKTLQEQGGGKKEGV